MGIKRISNSILQFVFCVLAWCCTTNTWSVSFLSFDARSISMGGTGVVTARSHNASLFNPALLIDNDPHRQTRLHAHTYAGARLIDRDNFIAAAEDFKERYERSSPENLLGQTIELATSTYDSGDQLRSAAGIIRQIQADINFLSDKPLRASASYGFAFSFPVKRWAVGGYQREFLILGSRVLVADRDNAAIDRMTAMVDGFADLIDEVRLLAEQDWESLEDLTLAEVVARTQGVVVAAVELDKYIDFAQLQGDVMEDLHHGKTIEDYLRDPLPSEFFTSIDSEGAEVSEQAISFARSLKVNSLPGHLQLGLNVKHVEFTTISFSQRVQDFELEDYRENDYRRTYQKANADLGLVYDSPGAFQVGIVVRNIVAHRLKTVGGQLIEIEPIARLGLGYVTQRLRFSADLDITRNEPLGFDPDKQYLGLGAEWFAWRNTALRLGVRTNMVDGETLPSMGFGLGNGNGHLDIALARSPNGDEWGVGIQAGLAF